MDHMCITTIVNLTIHRSLLPAGSAAHFVPAIYLSIRIPFFPLWKGFDPVAVPPSCRDPLPPLEEAAPLLSQSQVSRLLDSKPRTYMDQSPILAAVDLSPVQPQSSSQLDLSQVFISCFSLFSSPFFHSATGYTLRHERSW